MAILVVHPACGGAGRGHIILILWPEPYFVPHIQGMYVINLIIIVLEIYSILNINSLDRVYIYN